MLLDVVLPDGDGRDVCRTLRAEPGVPVVTLTARGSETHGVVGLELGAEDYVVEPFSAAEVVTRVRAVVRRTESAPASARAGTATSPIRIRDLVVDLRARRTTLHDNERGLSRKEFDPVRQNDSGVARAPSAG